MAPFVIVVWLLLLSALFSSSELAIIGVPLYKIKRFLVEYPENKGASLVLRLRNNVDRTLITILIGNNLVNVALSIYAAQLGESILWSVALAGAMAFVIVSVSITFLILFFGEIIPKVFATKYALRFAIVVAPGIQLITWLLYPFVFLLEIVIKSLHRVLWTHEEKVSRDDIEVFVEEWRKQWIFSSQEALIVHNFLEFREREVESVLTHRTEVFALSDSVLLSEAIDAINEEKHSRIPLYEGDKDNIIGMLTIREALRLSSQPENMNKPLKEFGLNIVAKVPITASVFDVFTDMKIHWRHFAVVIDEYGGTAGIVTFEDILEDLVGSIKDESDHLEEGDIVKVDHWVLKVKGDVLVRDVIDMLQLPWWRIPDELESSFSEEDTVSYVILQQLKEFATKGDSIEVGALVFEVLEVNETGNKIEKILVRHRVEV